MLKKKRYISKNHENNLYKKISALRNLIDFKTQNEQRQLRVNLSVYLKEKQLGTKIKNLLK